MLKRPIHMVTALTCFVLISLALDDRATAGQNKPMIRKITPSIGTQVESRRQAAEAAQIDGAILVVSATDGPMPQKRPDKRTYSARHFLLELDGK